MNPTQSTLLASSNEFRRSRVLPPLPSSAPATVYQPTESTDALSESTDPSFDPPSRFPSYRWLQPGPPTQVPDVRSAQIPSSPPPASVPTSSLEPNSQPTAPPSSSQPFFQSQFFPNSPPPSFHVTHLAPSVPATPPPSLPLEQLAPAVPTTPPPSIPLTQLSLSPTAPPTDYIEPVAMTLVPTLSLVTTTTEATTSSRLTPTSPRVTTTVTTTTTRSMIDGWTVIDSNAQAPPYRPVPVVPSTSYPPSYPPPSYPVPPSYLPTSPSPYSPFLPSPPTPYSSQNPYRLSTDLTAVSQTTSKKELSEFEILHELYHVHYLTVLQSIQQSDDQLSKGNQTTLLPDLWQNVLLYLRPLEIFHICLTCKFFNTMTDNETIWKQLYMTYNPLAINPVLDKSERSWKLKFKYESGIVSKSGLVERRTGVLWSVWGPIWLALSGVNVYIFATIENVTQKESYLKQLSREGLQSLLNEFQPTMVVNLKSASLLQSTVSLNGKQKFGLKTSQVEVYFNAPKTITTGWVRILHARIESLTHDFSVRPFRPSNF